MIIVKVMIRVKIMIIGEFMIYSGADKSRFWPNRALWGTSMKLGTIMV